MKTGEKIFIFGKAPESEFLTAHYFQHPIDKKKKIGFIKHPTTGCLYFNLFDFILPFKDKRYQKVIKSILPKKYISFKDVWMNTAAWVQIKKGIDMKKEDEIIHEWKEQLLF